MKKSLLLFFASLIAVGGLAFYGGMRYQQGKVGQRVLSARGTGIGQQRFGAGQNNVVRGQVVSQDSKSLTVQMGDGSSRVVLITDQTSVNQTAQASASDLKSGETVMVFGTPNSDGSITAQNVQINPQAPQARGNNQ